MPTTQSSMTVSDYFRAEETPPPDKLAPAEVEKFSGSFAVRLA